MGKFQTVVDFKSVDGKREIWVWDATGKLGFIFKESEIRKASRRAKSEI